MILFRTLTLSDALSLANLAVGSMAAIAAVLAFLGQFIKPRAKAVACLEGDWPTASVTVTNACDALFSVARIGLDVNGDGLTVKFPTVERMSEDKLPHLLVRGADLKASFSSRAAERIPVNVRTCVILELSDGTRLTCKGRIFA